MTTRAVIVTGGTLALMLASMLVSAPLAGQASKSLPRYGDMFPPGTVDRFGLTTINDYGPLTAPHKEAILLYNQQEFDKAISKMQGHIKTHKDDLRAYVIMVQAYEGARKLSQVVDFFRTARMSDRSFDSKSGRWQLKPQPRSFEIAEYYARVVASVRAEGRNSPGVPELKAEFISKAPRDRLEAMLLSSIVWCVGDAHVRDGRKVAYGYLTKDPDFYQLRTFYAHMWAHGSGPIHYGNGTVDTSAAVDGDPKVVMKHANMVIKDHPDYAPAYFVASTSTDKAEVRRNMERFIKGCHPESEWYKRAKTWLDRNK
jgi:hypothetical protein